jgi:hypothetical protein
MAEDDHPHSDGPDAVQLRDMEFRGDTRFGGWTTRRFHGICRDEKREQRNGVSV